MLTAIASINQAIEQGNASELWKCLKHESAKLDNVEDDAVNRYLEQLVAVKKEKGQVGLVLILSYFRVNELVLVVGHVRKAKHCNDITNCVS